MAISRQMSRSRTNVAWYGTPPEDSIKAHFDARQLVLIPCNDDDLRNPVFLSNQLAVIFSQAPEKPSRVASLLAQHAANILNHDCQVIVRVITAYRPTPKTVQNLATSFASIVADKDAPLPAAGLQVFSHAEQTKFGFNLKNIEPFPHVLFYTEFESWDKITNELTRIESGKRIQLKLRVTCEAGIKLCATQTLLLQRAFYDCTDVHLVKMADEGKSGGVVFRAYAELQEPLLGARYSWPQPYFVKIGPRQKIIQEYENYQALVDPYIPFHLGPHLVDERCHLGADLGIIVGDFVEKSESLGRCAGHGRAAQAIGNLFSVLP